MQIMALNIAEELAERHDVVVCTLSQYQRSCRFQISPVLTNCVFDDVSILKGIEVDVWFTLNASYAAIAPLLRAPVVAYFHGNDFLSPWRICLPRSLDLITRTRGLQRIRDTLRVALARHKIQQGLGHCVRILTNSSYSRTLILQTYQIEANRVLVCHPGVGSSYFQERESISARDYVHLMSVCRLDSSTRRKNIEGVLNALPLLEGAFPVRYTIVGDGDDRFRLEAIRDRLGLGHIVEFLGRASDDEEGRRGIRHRLSGSKRVRATHPCERNGRSYRCYYRRANWDLDRRFRAVRYCGRSPPLRCKSPRFRPDSDPCLRA